MKKTQRPEITLIISSSIDGCLIGRDSDSLDSNKNWKDKKNIRGIVQQFFDFSPNNSDIFNLITSSTVIRIGVESKTFVPKKESLRLVVLDEENKLKTRGIKNLALSVEKLILVKTDEKNKSSSKNTPSNCKILHYDKKIDHAHLAKTLRQKHEIRKLTIQSAGLLNSQWVDTGMVDFLTVVFYPLLVGKNGTPTLIDTDTFKVRPLKFISSKIFDINYLFLRYKVMN